MAYDYISPYKRLLEITFAVVQSSTEDFQSKDGWYSYAHALALKFFRHLSTIQNLCQPQLDLTTGDIYVDVASVQSLVRTTLENFLVFAHIFGPKDQSLVRLRFVIWQRCGLMERQKYKSSTSEHSEKLTSEQRDIDDLKREIEATPLFHSIYSSGPKGQQTRLLNGEWMAVNKMPILADEAGIHEIYFRNIYKHTSGYSHTGFISAMQVTQARNLETQSLLAIGNLGTGLLIMTHFLIIFSQISDRAKKTLAEEPDVKELFESWHIQKEDWERIYNPR